MIVIIIITINFMLPFFLTCLIFLDCLFILNIQACTSSSAYSVRGCVDAVSDGAANHHLLSTRPINPFPPRGLLDLPSLLWEALSPLRFGYAESGGTESLSSQPKVTQPSQWSSVLEPPYHTPLHSSVSKYHFPPARSLLHSSHPLGSVVWSTILQP